MSYLESLPLKAIGKYNIPSYNTKKGCRPVETAGGRQNLLSPRPLQVTVFRVATGFALLPAVDSKLN